MPRYSDNNRRKSRDDDDRRPARGNSRNNDRKGGGRNTSRKQSTSYHPILQIFAVDKGDRISLNIKRIQTEKSDISDVISLEEWLFFCAQVYEGVKGYSFAGSLWESTIPQADWTGNIRLSDEQLEQLQEDFENSGKKTRAKSKVKPTKGKPPKYEVPEEDDEEDDYEEAEDNQEETEDDDMPPY